MSGSRSDVFTGKAWILRNDRDDLLNSVDTDQIYHNAHLAVTELDEMGRYALGNLEGWEEFPDKVSVGDVLIAGDNFGAGSSRQHAVDCFMALGVAAVIARSFAPIYKRNAINSGLPILSCPGLTGSTFLDGQEIEVRFTEARVVNASTGQTLARCDPPTAVQLQIYEAGNLFAYGSAMTD